MIFFKQYLQETVTSWLVGSPYFCTLTKKHLSYILWILMSSLVSRRRLSSLSNVFLDVDNAESSLLQWSSSPPPCAWPAGLAQTLASSSGNSTLFLKIKVEGKKLQTLTHNIFSFTSSTVFFTSHSEGLENNIDEELYKGNNITIS